jgi:nucleotide-binding universal stress UspA family protein
MAKVISRACQRPFETGHSGCTVGDMTSTHPTPSGNIVVGVDGSPSSEHAVMWAAEEAALQRRRLTLVHTQKQVSANEMAWLAGAGIPPRQVNAEMDEDAERILERARSVAADLSPGVPVETVLGYGDARGHLLDLTTTASMVVVGSRGHGPVAGLLLGSVSGALVRHSDTPVVVVRPTPAPGGGDLIAADGSEESLELVELAYREASLHQLPLTIVHCLWDALIARTRWTTVDETDPAAEEARLFMAEAVAGMGEKFPDVDLSVLVTRGAVDACLVDLSARYDLLVIGRPVRPLLARLTVSGLTTPVAEHAHCPVLVVP